MAGNREAGSFVNSAVIRQNGSITHYGLNNGPIFLNTNIGLNFVMCERSFSAVLDIFELGNKSKGL